MFIFVLGLLNSYEVGYETIYESKRLEVSLVLENTTAETKKIVMSDCNRTGGKFLW